MELSKAKLDYEQNLINNFVIIKIQRYFTISEILLMQNVFLLSCSVVPIKLSQTGKGRNV